MFCTKYLLGLGLAAGILGSEVNLPEFQEEKQPGLLRVSGVSDTDRVLLDGELIGNGRRLMQFGNKLLVNPGEYTVTIVNGESGASCRSKIVIRENQTAVARCDSRPSQPGEQEIL